MKHNLNTINTWVLPGSRIEKGEESWLFINEPVQGDPRPPYTNAQIDDYRELRRRDYLWSPPLKMTVRARFSHESGGIKGTAGFGFWNDPFRMSGGGSYALPRALWFFYGSPENNMKLDLNTPGHGWKVATLDARRLPFYLLAPTAPFAIPLMHIKPLFRLLWPIGQRAVGVSESLVPVSMTDWHTYHLDWKRSAVSFYVDGDLILACNTAPKGPLGFVMWIDNQAMVATPQGQFRWIIVPLSQSQWMEVSEVVITPQPSQPSP